LLLFNPIVILYHTRGEINRKLPQRALSPKYLLGLGELGELANVGEVGFDWATRSSFRATTAAVPAAGMAGR
jgi:hypothetical protein